MKYIGLLIIVSSIFILLLNFEYNKEIQNQNEDRVDNYLKVTSNIETSDKSSTPESVTTPITSTFNYSGILEIPKINLKAGFANSDDKFTIINYFKLLAISQNIETSSCSARTDKSKLYLLRTF